MAVDLVDIQVIGLHPVAPSEQLFEETVETQWGSGLSGVELERARDCVREHFAGLYILEVQVNPRDADVDWMAVTQAIPNSPQANWQVPYDERRVGERLGRWAFFFHFVQLGQPLETPAGPRRIPSPTSRPVHLVDMEYEAPG